MGYTQYDATLDLARILGMVRDGVTTAVGSTTTVIDSLVPEPNDWYNNGTIWVAAHTSMNTEAAKAKVITDYASSTHTFTTEAFEVGVGSGVSYSAANEKFPLWLLRQCVRSAIVEIGSVVSEKTFTSDGSQVYYAYTYSGGAYVAATAVEIDEQILSVEVAQADEEPYNWQPVRRWQSVPYLDDGHKGIMFFEGAEPQSGRLIRLIYAAPAASPSADTDEINPQIHPDLLKWSAAVYAWRYRLGRVRNDEPEAPDKLKEAVGMAGQMAYRHRIGRPPLSGLARW